jgi:hypothetical protein
MEKILLKTKTKLKGHKFEYHFIIVSNQKLTGELKVIAATDAEAFASAQASIDGHAIESYVAPPVPEIRKGDPREATETDQKAIVRMAMPSLAMVAANWKKSCILGDVEENNCAHYLSDAFIRAGYAELTHSAAAPAPQITIWCDYNDPPRNPQARVIRAREMNAWFKSKCSNPLTVKPVKKGFFAVFQLNEAAYWGGHVLLYDSDKDTYYGTGAYWNWPTQLFYQW